MRFDIITIFPSMFEGFLNESLIKHARAKNILDIRVHDLRDYTSDKHRTVDDRPYGGGPGMILKVEPIYKALKKIAKGKGTRIIMMDPAGKPFDQKTAGRYSKYNQVVILSGRYEGFDARLRGLVDERISIGPYVLSGGELPAMVIMEAVSRYIPGVIGHAKVLDEETNVAEGYKEYPQYTRPEKIKIGKKIISVPKVLLSGDHKKIADWRRDKSKAG